MSCFYGEQVATHGRTPCGVVLCSNRAAHDDWEKGMTKAAPPRKIVTTWWCERVCRVGQEKEKAPVGAGAFGRGKSTTFSNGKSQLTR